LDQWRTPPLRLQVLDCSTFFIKCLVPSTVVFVENLLNVFLLLFKHIAYYHDDDDNDDDDDDDDHHHHHHHHLLPQVSFPLVLFPLN
jgi:ABC-type Zn2+ transport system substrate-binding protein/surface adhesin